MVRGWVKDIVEEGQEGRNLRVGDIVRHPDGRLVKILAGQFWGRYGISNFWDWAEVTKKGVISEKIESGYGWMVKED